VIAIPYPVEDDGYAPGLWITTAPFVFAWRGCVYTIPPGFVYDCYSIPRLLWSWRPPRHGWGDEAALIHDWLRRFRLLLGLTVADTDAAFLEAMRYYGIRAARIKYLAVSVAVWSYGRGDGWPPRDVRKAMAARGHCWEYYRGQVAESLQNEAHFAIMTNSTANSSQI
jgi:hypothetical protein